GLQAPGRGRVGLTGNVVASLANPCGDGRAAVPRPMIGRRRKGRCRSSDVGILTARAMAGRALRAVSPGCGCHRGGGGQGRQRVCPDTRGRRRGRKRTHILRPKRTIAAVRNGLEAWRVRTAGGAATNQRENEHARPSTRARFHLGARHVVTHSYATNVEFEINQPRVNNALIINAQTRAYLVENSGKKCHSSCAWPGNIGTKRTGMRFSRRVPVCDLVSLMRCCEPSCEPRGKIMTPWSASWSSN